MAGISTKAAEEQEGQQMLSNDVHEQQQSLTLNSCSIGATKCKSRNKPAALRNAKKVTISATVVSPFLFSCSILLEEGKDRPVFWNGENPVPLIKWGPSSAQESEQNKQQVFSTIHDFLSTYAAGGYLRKCSMSLQVSSTKYINNLRMSDPFSKIFDHYNKDGKPVTLLLTHANGDDCESGYSKFTLYIRELNGKKVLWNGSIPTNRLVAKLNQSDMNITIENCLLNYVASGYLSQNCQVDLVKECSDTIRSKREELSTISMEDLVNTLFKGNSASIVIRSSGGGGVTDSCNDNGVLQFLDHDDISASSSTKIPVFTSPPVECNWVGMTWGGIKDEVRELVSSVEITMRDTILSTDSYASVLEKKRSLETAMRRRSRVVDEIWRAYLALRRAHNDVLNGNSIAGHSSLSQRTAAGTGGDVDHALQIHRSCIDFLSSSLIRCGLELELYDEETQGLSRVAGVGVGIAVVVAICTVVYYF